MQGKNRNCVFSHTFVETEGRIHKERTAATDSTMHCASLCNPCLPRLKVQFTKPTELMILKCKQAYKVVPRVLVLHLISIMQVKQYNKTHVQNCFLCYAAGLVQSLNHRFMLFSCFVCVEGQVFVLSVPSARISCLAWLRSLLP